MDIVKLLEKKVSRGIKNYQRELIEMLKADEPQRKTRKYKMRSSNGNGNGATRHVVRNKKTVYSPKEMARRKTQGKYLGALAGLNKKQRSHVKAIFKKDGVRAAISAAKAEKAPASA